MTALENIVSLFKTRQQLEEEKSIDAFPYSVVTTVYKALHHGVMDNIHIPHSDVYFVRAALEKHSGVVIPLDVVERAMKLEGWRDRKGKDRFDLFSKEGAQL